MGLENAQQATDVKRMQPQTQQPVIQVDIISDVMCPWCIVGFKQLEMALAQTSVGARIRWHPFELNPDMGADGENLGDHIMRKYGRTKEQSVQNRQNLQDVGKALGIAFNFSDESRIVNSFKAHILLDFAATKGLQHPLKMALFDAHFAKGLDVSDADVLLTIAVSVGIPREDSAHALANKAHADAVRAQQSIWRQNGISGVPTMIFDEKYLVTGAQGPQTYAQLLQKATLETA